MDENGGLGLVAVGLLAVMLAVGVVRGLVGTEDTKTGQPVAGATTSTRSGLHPSSTSTTTSTVMGRAEESEMPEVADTGAEVVAGPDAPVGPGLPPERAEQAKAVAAEVLRADVSGEGRERFGDYWDGDLYRPCCRDVVIDTSVARAVEAREATVVVTLVWTAELLDAGPPREQVETDVYLVERDGSWAPIRPSEGGG